jgi:pimeloyl-ACP methyl ester carboxylesterase
MSTPRTSSLEIVESGEGSAPVVFVHGVLDRGRSFDNVAALLAAECRMAWYDRRGYGDSVDAPGAPVGIDGHIEDLLGVLEGRPAVVVGHSFGGVTVLGAALAAPDLVHGVVLYETALAWIPEWDDRALRSILWGNDPEGDAVRMMFRGRFDEMHPNQQAARLSEARAFVAEERSVRTGVAPFDVSGLEPPLVFGYSNSPPFHVVADHMAGVVRRVEIVELPGAGHNAHRTQPGPFADLVRRGIALARS